jgi:23S rRNA (guanosine2251-2'-O)-methyltransferase
MIEHLEGRLSVIAALLAQQREFQLILIRHGTHIEKIQELLDLAAEHRVPVKYVAHEELAALTHGATHGGVVAICSPKPRMTPQQLLRHLDTLDEPPLLLLIEGVDDARNLGFTLRSADALGIHAVLIKKHLWDFDPVEVARPSSGAYERMPLVQIDDLELLQKLQQDRSMQLIGCIANARRTIYQADLTPATILAIGGEKRGLSGAVRSICDRYMTIPTKPGASSLSLSHAAAIVMAEAMWQRNAKR